MTFAAQSSTLSAFSGGIATVIASFHLLSAPLDAVRHVFRRPFVAWMVGEPDDDMSEVFDIPQLSTASPSGHRRLLRLRT